MTPDTTARGGIGTMRAVIQRVLSASVRVDGEVVGELDRPGLLVYLGVTHDDGPRDVSWIARKVWETRLFEGEKSASEIDAGVLVVSQFTLYGDARKGNRPSFVAAAAPAHAEALYERFCDRVHAARGVFGARMEVELINDGPVTLLIEL